MNNGGRFWIVAITAAMLAAPSAALATARKPPKVHTVALGTAKRVPYSIIGDPAGATPKERSLNVRPLVVDNLIKEWTTGEAHEVTDRTFLVRRAIRLNDSLPGDKQSRWVWQRGPWLMVERVKGHIVALKLPDYDPGVSQVIWFRDYAAYCGLSANGKNLYAVVAQLEARKPVLVKKLGAFDPEKHPNPVCGLTTWQQAPVRITFHPTGKEPVVFDLVPGSAVLVEDSADEAESSADASEQR
jgi:hypothetical protein